MRIACLQFAPTVGDVDTNIDRADRVLHECEKELLEKGVDLIVLPELAFSGYTFRSLEHISPFLEPTAAGISSLWARTTALKHDCHVTVGYPETVDVTPKWPADPEYYNSTVTVNLDGDTVANYRKSFLYYTDETWALEGPGFYSGNLEGLGSVAMGICMDLNPYKFEAPWHSYEFAHHILHSRANLVIVSMAWLTRENASSFLANPLQPDMDTLAYWIARLEPLIRAEIEDEIIVVLANRAGIEDDAVYAGTSVVLGIHHGEVSVYGILGRGENKLLLVDTSNPPVGKLISDSKAAAAARDSFVGEAHGIPEPEPGSPESYRERRKSIISLIRSEPGSDLIHSDHDDGMPRLDISLMADAAGGDPQSATVGDSILDYDYPDMPKSASVFVGTADSQPEQESNGSASERRPRSSFW